MHQRLWKSAVVFILVMSFCSCIGIRSVAAAPTADGFHAKDGSLIPDDKLWSYLKLDQKTPSQRADILRQFRAIGFVIKKHSVQRITVNLAAVYTASDLARMGTDPQEFAATVIQLSDPIDPRLLKMLTNILPLIYDPVIKPCAAAVLFRYRIKDGEQYFDRALDTANSLNSASSNNINGSSDNNTADQKILVPAEFAAEVFAVNRRTDKLPEILSLMVREHDALSSLLPILSEWKSPQVTVGLKNAAATWQSKEPENPQISIALACHDDQDILPYARRMFFREVGKDIVRAPFAAVVIKLDGVAKTHFQQDYLRTLLTPGPFTVAIAEQQTKFDPRGNAIESIGRLRLTQFVPMMEQFISYYCSASSSKDSREDNISNAQLAVAAAKSLTEIGSADASSDLLKLIKFLQKDEDNRQYVRAVAYDYLIKLHGSAKPLTAIIGNADVSSFLATSRLRAVPDDLSQQVWDKP